VRLRASSDTLAIGFVFVGIATLACLSPVQSDTWWLLRAGREIWLQHHIPLTDTYSHTAAGLYWPNHEWLVEALFYGAYVLGGFPLLTLGCAAAIVGAWTLSWRLTSGVFETRFLLFAAAIVSAASAWAVRPQVFTLFMFALVCTVLVSRRYRWVPVLFLVWANLHGAVALGFLAIGAAGLARVIEDRRLPWNLAAAGAGALLATLITPLGLGLWTFIPESMARSRVNQLIEWQPPALNAAHAPFWALAIALPLAAVWFRRKLEGRTLALVLITLAVLPFAARAIRNVSVFMLVGVPALTALVAPSAPRAPRKRFGEREGVNAILLTAIACVAALVVISLWRLPSARLGWEPISPDAVAAIRACDAPLYNTYDDGGVLIWFVPERPVFIDNRQDPYALDVLSAAHTVETDGRYETLFEKFAIGCVAVPAESPVTARLRAAGAWSQTYRDVRWVVFAKSER
jgi:hypothetical protein